MSSYEVGASAPTFRPVHPRDLAPQEKNEGTGNSS